MKKNKKTFSEKSTNSEKRVLDALIENSRQSSREIAKKTNLSTATVIKKINEMKEKGIIRGFSAKVDCEKLGFDFPAIIEIRVAKGKLMEVENKIAKEKEVKAVYDITGHFDAAILADFRKRKDLDVFIKKLQKMDFVERTETKIILNKVKEE
ncbi:Lrp/AsnC family transcriptional regulator [Candidatus Micrarchaeota archaeon]|nr:Lrp/AsnC family transcriptional regulator [Candidatus Micrarchaeota archaeon]MBU2477301.1 Lrp/AsnC family transcriptional regulator [Candidatus Micrarchaeota archaeon]